MYVVEKHGTKFVTRKQYGDRKIMGEHDSHLKAFAQMRALYAAEHKKGVGKKSRGDEVDPTGG